jgi:signal transduction histidine kinase
MKLETKFASAEREIASNLYQQHEIFFNNELFAEISNSVSQMLVVLNKQRQVVFANQLFLDLMNYKSLDSYIGKRPGEILNCIHASQTSGGCGTTEFCSTCGAVNAILESQAGKKSTKECRIVTRSNDALDLQITATPFTIQNTQFSIFVVNDISHEKRKQILERVFFHDVLNSAGGISGLSNIIGEIEDHDELTSVAQMIQRSADDLVSEIQMQRELSAAERGDIELHKDKVASLVLLRQVAILYSQHEVSKDKLIVLDTSAREFIVETDAVLLKRILGNMTKNALEASLPEETVTLSSVDENGKYRFTVHNPRYIERKVQLQLFKRSFSTKGKGRGIGTYSMKLFGEKYLKGKVGFDSSPEKGTTFFIELK